MEINIVDTVDRELLKIWRQLNGLNQNPIEISNGPNGVDRMVTKVIEVAKKPGSIDVLRIYSHGNSGAFVITGGDHDPEPTSMIATWNLSKLETSLRRLTPYFAPTGRVEIYGCYVATHSDDGVNHTPGVNAEGEELISKLAKLWHVRVIASGNTAKGLPIASLGFVGTVIQADPWGQVGCAEAIPIQKAR